jgi:hypothetical protein
MAKPLFPAMSSVTLFWPSIRRDATFALSAGGIAFTIVLLVVGFQTGLFGGTNDYTETFDKVGDMMRAGQNPYSIGLVYSPPFALACAAISWLPVPVASLILLSAEILALRYVAGSWTGVGIVAWCPLLAFELALGQVNLILGACILATVRGHGWAGIVGGFLKISPVLAIREWRTAALALGVIFLVMLPWFSFWFDWAHAITGAVPQGGVGPMVPIPLPVRLVFAAVLLALRRPWATALACVVAIPLFHYQTLLLLIVPVAVLVSRAGSELPPADHVGEGSIGRSGTSTE